MKYTVINKRKKEHFDALKRLEKKRIELEIRKLKGLNLDITTPLQNLINAVEEDLHLWKESVSETLRFAKHTYTAFDFLKLEG